MISERFESFAQALRVFTEQHLRFAALLAIDAPEALGNIDHAIDGILNAFHGLYDATKIEAPQAFDFYGDPICGLVLKIRNARHHNKANRIRSIYRAAQTETGERDYLMIDFAAGQGEVGGSFADYQISWSDVLLMINQEPERFAEAMAASRLAIGADIFEPWCADHGYSESQIFLNLVPILSAAGSACTHSLSPHIVPQSVEADTFLRHFQNVDPANFRDQSYVELTSSAFQTR